MALSLHVTYAGCTSTPISERTVKQEQSGQFSVPFVFDAAAEMDRTYPTPECPVSATGAIGSHKTRDQISRVLPRVPGCSHLYASRPVRKASSAQRQRTRAETDFHSLTTGSVCGGVSKAAGASSSWRPQDAKAKRRHRYSRFNVTLHPVSARDPR